MTPIMTSIFKTLPLVALAAVVATPSFAAHARHYHHHAHYSGRVVNSYDYGPAGPPQRPVYSYYNGQMIGRANDENIRIQMQNDDMMNHR